MRLAVSITIIICLFLAIRSIAEPAYWYDIQNFKKQDSMHPPKQHAILFIGSSSFTKWTDVQAYFPGHAIINRGFGGSTLLDVIHYVPEVVYPYNPKQVVIYCGENDIAYSDTVTAATVLARFKILFGLIREKYHNENIVFVSIKPSPSRQKLLPLFQQANALIKQFLATEKNTTFVDVFDLMLTKDGKLLPELYVDDMLHMKPAGYAIWKKALEPVLEK